MSIKISFPSFPIFSIGILAHYKCVLVSDYDVVRLQQYGPVQFMWWHWQRYCGWTVVGPVIGGYGVHRIGQRT